jgi:hypothetical protein
VRGEALLHDVGGDHREVIGPLHAIKQGTERAEYQMPLEVTGGSSVRPRHQVRQDRVAVEKTGEQPTIEAKFLDQQAKEPGEPGIANLDDLGPCAADRAEHTDIVEQQPVAVAVRRDFRSIDRHPDDCRPLAVQRMLGARVNEEIAVRRLATEVTDLGKMVGADPAGPI